MRRAVLLAIALPLTACVRSPVRPPARLPEAPAARLAAVEARESAVRTFRARFTAVARNASGERRSDGVLVVAKPDRFRLRLMLPFGITVFDYVCVGDHVWMTLPLADPQQSPGGDAFTPFARDDLGAAFLRGAFAFPEPCTATAAAGELVDVECAPGTARHRVLRIDRRGLVEETTLAGDAPRLRIRYADYRRVDHVVMPFRITLEYPQRGASVDITVDAYEVNAPIAAAAFAPPAGARESSD
jgi:outer membrane biogenesis lipoprotein LolB